MKSCKAQSKLCNERRYKKSGNDSQQKKSDGKNERNKSMSCTNSHSR